jgi:predicted transcriptional regulator
MAKPKRTPTQRELDLQKITALYLRGTTQSDIGKELGVVQSQVSYDLKEIQKRWRESALVNINEVKQRELARIDELEIEYWQAWRRSIGEVTKTVTSRNALRGDTASISKETLNGNPAYLQGVQWCIEQRCKLFGIYEATKISLDWRKALQEQGHDAGAVFEQLIQSYINAVK